MTPLREAMTRAMQMRGFSERTHHSYLLAVTDLARWTKRSPAGWNMTESASLRAAIAVCLDGYAETHRLSQEGETTDPARTEDAQERPCPKCRRRRLRRNRPESQTR